MPDIMPAPEELDVLNNRGNLVVGLYQNQVAITPQTTLANLVKANFDGYEEAYPAGFDEVDLIEDGILATLIAQALTWEKAAGDNGNTIFGFFLLLRTTAGDYFLGAYAFPKPFPMMEEGQKCTFRPRVQLTNFEFPEL